MRSRAALLLALLLGLVAAPSARADEPETPAEGSVADGRHFRVVCHFDSPAVAKEALAVVEQAWVSARTLLRLRPSDLETPVTVRILRNADDYQRIEKTITAGAFARNNAFSSWERREAFVAMEPSYDDAVLERVGLTAQTRRMLAHEAGHLLVYHALPNFRHHPRWLSEGLAIWIADRTMSGSTRIEALVERPFASTRLVRFQNMATEGRLPPAERILKEQYPDVVYNDRYALWWGFARYLLSSRHQSWFEGVVRDVAKMPDSPALRARLLERFKRRFDDELTDLDAELETFAASLQPAWHETLRTLSTESSAWAQLAFSSKNARAWRTERAGDRYTIHGALEFISSGAAQMNVLLGRGDAGFVSVAFQSTGGVTILDYRSESGDWTRRAYATTSALDEPGTVGFEVTVSGCEVVVAVAGRKVVSATSEHASLSGPFGLGVQVNSAGLWHAVKIRRER